MIHIFHNLETLSQAAAETFVNLADQAIRSRGRFSVALSGGNTPRRMYELLASKPLRERVHWGAVHVFWGDERCVPADDPRSNARMAHQALLDQLPLPADNIHPISGDLPPVQAAARYETELRAFFADGEPAFDLILLGLGENSHTASLFPHTPVLHESQRWAAEVYVPSQDMYRVTLTAPIINHAREVLFLVSGAGKAEALQNVLEGAFQPDEFPAQLIRPSGAHATWLVDRAASHKLAEEIMEAA